MKRNVVFAEVVFHFNNTLYLTPFYLIVTLLKSFEQAFDNVSGNLFPQNYSQTWFYVSYQEILT